MHLYRRQLKLLMIIMKRKRTEIPATVKKRICKLKNGNGKVTRQVIVDKIRGEFDVEVVQKLS